MTDLITRLSKLDAPDREVDADIWLLTTPGAARKILEVKSSTNQWAPYTIDETRDKTGYLITVPAYTASVDAAIALAGRVLPGWTFEHIGQDYIRSMGASDDLMPIGWTVEITDGRAVIQGQAPTLPLAICIALLRAKEASNG